MENELESGLLSVCVCVGVCSIPRSNIVIIENRHDLSLKTSWTRRGVDTSSSRCLRHFLLMTTDQNFF